MKGWGGTALSPEDLQQMEERIHDDIQDTAARQEELFASIQASIDKIKDAQTKERLLGENFAPIEDIKGQYHKLQGLFDENDQLTSRQEDAIDLKKEILDGAKGVYRNLSAIHDVLVGNPYDPVESSLLVSVINEFGEISAENAKSPTYDSTTFFNEVDDYLTRMIYIQTMGISLLTFARQAEHEQDALKEDLENISKNLQAQKDLAISRFPLWMMDKDAWGVGDGAWITGKSIFTAQIIVGADKETITGREVLHSMPVPKGQDRLEKGKFNFLPPEEGWSPPAECEPMVADNFLMPKECNPNWVIIPANFTSPQRIDWDYSYERPYMQGFPVFGKWAGDLFHIGTLGHGVGFDRRYEIRLLCWPHDEDKPRLIDFYYLPQFWAFPDKFPDSLLYFRFVYTDPTNFIDTLTIKERKTPFGHLIAHTVTPYVEGQQQEFTPRYLKIKEPTVDEYNRIHMPFDGLGFKFADGPSDATFFALSAPLATVQTKLEWQNRQPNPDAWRDSTPNHLPRGSYPTGFYYKVWPDEIKTNIAVNNVENI